MKQKLIIPTVAAGLFVGCVLGMIGTAVPSDKIRNVLWAVDSCGLILAAALFTPYCFKGGYDVVGAAAPVSLLRFYLVLLHFASLRGTR